MKRIIAASILLVIVLAIYIRFSDPIALKINNQMNLASEIQWTCNSVVSDEKFIVEAKKTVEKKIYPSCEGKFGIILTNTSGTNSQELIGYIPTGKTEKIMITLNEPNKIEFKINESQ